MEEKTVSRGLRKERRTRRSRLLEVKEGET